MKLERTEKKQRECWKRRRGGSEALMIASRDGVSVEGPQGAVENEVNTNTSETKLLTQHESLTTSQVQSSNTLQELAIVCQSSADEDRVHLVDIRNVDLLKDCHESTHTGSKQRSQSPFSLKLKPLSSCCRADSVLVVVDSSLGDAAERDVIDAHDGLKVRLYLSVDEKSRLKTRRRPDGKIKKKCHRQDNGKNFEVIRLDVVRHEKQPNELTITSRHETKEKAVDAKHFAKSAGKRLLKGLRVGCKFLWSGLVLHAKPFGALDSNVEKVVWEEKLEDCDRKRHYSGYSDEREPKTLILDRRP